MAGSAPGLYHLPRNTWESPESSKCLSWGQLGLLRLQTALNLMPALQEVEQVTFSTALAGLTDHLAVGLKLQVASS